MVLVFAGKAGAIVGAFGFGQLFLTAGISTTLAILAATNFLGKLRSTKCKKLCQSAKGRPLASQLC